MKAQKLPSGHYRIRVVINNKRISRTFNTELEANNWYKLVKATKGKAATIEVSGLDINITQIAHKHSLDDELNTIDKMTGKHFEEYCAYLLRYSGLLQYCDFKSTKTTGDFGADIIIETEYGEKICVQCKRIAKKGHVGTDAIQEVVASKKHYNAKRCMIMTNNHLTTNAISLAISNNVLIIDRDKLIELIKIKNKNIRPIQQKKQWKEFVSIIENL